MCVKILQDVQSWYSWGNNWSKWTWCFLFSNVRNGTWFCYFGNMGCIGCISGPVFWNKFFEYLVNLGLIVIVFFFISPFGLEKRRSFIFFGVLWLNILELLFRYKFIFKRIIVIFIINFKSFICLKFFNAFAFIFGERLFNGVKNG